MDLMALCTKTLRIMKLTTFILLAGLLQVQASGFSQRVTIHEKNAPLQKIFKEINKQTGFQFFFNAKLLEQAGNIDIEATNEPVENVLQTCFKNLPVTFSVSNNAIYIQEKKKPDSANLLPVDVHGRVTDSTGAPLSGASITVKGTRKGTSTDANGNFELKNIGPNAVLIISFTGYLSKEIKLNGQDSFDISLIHSTNQLDQVQVIAYGTTTQRLATGDVNIVTSGQLESQPVTNAAFAMEGLVPGLTITQSSGNPNAGFTTQIRGQNSIANFTNPLYVIDGVPYTFAGGAIGLGYNITLNSDLSNPLNFINPLDIESISILKDADATSIYGSRGANGVILITTKKGRIGKTKIGVSFSAGGGKADHFMKLLNTKQYLEMREQAFANDSLTPDINSAPDLVAWDTTKYTDWQKKLIGGTANTLNTQVSISGGNKNTQYLISGNYRKNGTVYPGDFIDNRGSLNLNLNNVSDNGKFKSSISINYVADNSKLPTTDETYLAQHVLPPNTPDFIDSKGDFLWPSGLYFNPYTYFLRKYLL
ncbi:MAG TPA: carboxypeptidase-like regulatory domain-containing protein, partial [Puia sp.]|nr:carboxypeptidase-like regulatory domain-containing protein [Puia sp.]